MMAEMKGKQILSDMVHLSVWKVSQAFTAEPDEVNVLTSLKHRLTRPKHRLTRQKHKLTRPKHRLTRPKHRLTRPKHKLNTLKHKLNTPKHKLNHLTPLWLSSRSTCSRRGWQPETASSPSNQNRKCVNGPSLPAASPTDASFRCLLRLQLLTRTFYR